MKKKEPKVAKKNTSTKNTESKKSLKNKHILLAEDDRFLSKVLTDKLNRIGYTVFVAMDGIEALQHIGAEKIDLVLLDLIMPNKDGFEVLEEMKKDKKMKKLPVVVLSNLGQESDIKKAKLLGAKGYLVKSDLGINDVVEKVKKYMK